MIEIEEEKSVDMGSQQRDMEQKLAEAVRGRHTLHVRGGRPKDIVTSRASEDNRIGYNPLS